MELKGLQLNKLIQNTKDRIVSVPVQDNGLVPLEIPGMEAIITRDIQRTVAEVEQRLKVHLQPKRKTNLPGTVREAYEDKVKYVESYVKSPQVKMFPQWHHLDEEQASLYPARDLYIDGTLPWDMLTNQQKAYITSQVVYAPNKIDTEELHDGKGRSFMRLHERHILTVHRASVRVRTLNQADQFKTRSFSENEMIIYREEGAIQLMPKMAVNQMITSSGPLMGAASTVYGIAMPKIPQVLSVDYTFGLKEIPADLMDAVSMLSANRVFETVNVGMSKGLLSFSVQGFSAHFGKGLYSETMNRYQDRADTIFANHTYLSITGV